MKIKQAIVGKLLALACALSGILPAGVQAAWPDQPINMIIAYAPGGGTDIAARVMIPFIEKYLGDNAKINVINRPGASGVQGSWAGSPEFITSVRDPLPGASQPT